MKVSQGMYVVIQGVYTFCGHAKHIREKVNNTHCTFVAYVQSDYRIYLDNVKYVIS